MTVPSEMTLVNLAKPGGPEMLALGRGPVPAPRTGEILIKVEAAGVNRPDVQQRKGLYPPPPDASPILGLEVAGTVAALGDGVEAWAIGDEVCGLANGGGYAEYCVIPALQCLPWPEGYDATRAAALPETYFTVWANAFGHGALASGETILIHGGTSGIGVTAIKLARAFGATVYATAGSDEKCEACKRLGAHEAINYRSQDFAAEIARLTGKRGVNVVLDMVGGDYTSRNVASLAFGGRLVVIGFMGGGKSDAIDLTRIATRRLVITGSTMRPRTAAEKGAIAAELREKVWPLLAKGECGPEIFETFPLGEAAAAHALMEESRHIGKIMLAVA
ncbi:NAD(P)H-quinone oxidoreductase [Enterovirga rhinocerotis]|uniref:Putative PIG3 family NAD(P)H quinone oxidoreductase n=1 Tax=Enterovirga rhinocerotis TaxID=1339210 RepID=A0A4R7C0P1_9HYPH|nr:NAD(P)H-quinone oxidoreductase [Enterovirga rhinocerotis]TDR90057.1 putative PIG3 family NAD(P)H quinone oxidoreductase [Enterovirga rhinocerotis]